MFNVDLFMKTVSEISRLSIALGKTMSDCAQLLDQLIDLPIQVPFVDSDTYSKIRNENYNEVIKTFRYIAKKMRVNKVIAPIISMWNCEMNIIEEDIDSVRIGTWLDAYLVTLIKLKVISDHSEVEFPIAYYTEVRNRTTINNAYRDSLLGLLLATLFLYRNPWFLDAVKKTYARVYGNATDTLLSTISALNNLAKIVGPSVFD